MSSASKSIGFAMVLCVVCSLLLTAAATGLKPYQLENARIDRQRNILKSVGLVAEDRKVDGRTVDELFARNIRRIWTDASGCILPAEGHGPGDLPLYLYETEGDLQAYIVPVDTRGLWGKIKAYLAIRSDGETVAGFTVFSHQETPGLGGEIEKRWFQNNFLGKKIVNPQGDFVSIKVAKGKVDAAVAAGQRSNYVDGISGATLTGKYLTAGLQSILTEYEPVAVRLRNPAAAACAEPDRTPPQGGKTP